MQYPLHSPSSKHTMRDYKGDINNTNNTLNALTNNKLNARTLTYSPHSFHLFRHYEYGTMA